MQQVIDKKQVRIWLYLFLAVHFLLWTLVPMLSRQNLPLDAIEGTIWGHQLEWGYDKNPFMNGWLTALAIYLDGYRGWLIYAFSQVSVILCFWSVWQIAKRMLAPTQALLAVVLLELIQYYNFHAIDFNDNTLELGLWGLTTYFFYRAVNETNPSKRYLPWLMTGLFAALGMMTKYYTLALLAGMTIYLFTQPSARKQLHTSAPWLGLTLFSLIILPHVYWLTMHEFITVTYVAARASSPPAWSNHLFYPLQFCWQQLEVFAPVVIAGGLLWITGSRQTPSSDTSSLTPSDRSFLCWVGLGPMLLTVLLSCLLGIKLRAGWGMPLQSLWGIILMAALRPLLDQKRLVVFFVSLYTLLAILLTSYVFSLIDSSDTSTANFPGREIAQSITQQWRETYHTPLVYVAGSRWVGGNIGFYSPDHPAVFIEWDQRKAPWIKDEALRKHGAVFVWNLSENESMPEEVKARYASLQPPVILEFDWKRNVAHLPPSRIAVAFLPPRESLK